jgi:hypothetical protein
MACRSKAKFVAGLADGDGEGEGLGEGLGEGDGVEEPPLSWNLTSLTIGLSEALGVKLIGPRLLSCMTMYAARLFDGRVNPVTGPASTEPRTFSIEYVRL